MHSLQTANKDVLKMIFAKLSSMDLLALEKCSSLFKKVIDDDKFWIHHCIKEFGLITPDDVCIKNTPLKTEGYRSAFLIFYRYYTVTLSQLGEEKSSMIMYNRVTTQKKQKYYCAAHGFLFRRSDACMTIPSDAFETGNIRPRRGDMIVDFQEYGYRNNGLTFWNGMIRVYMDTRSRDDYGTTPHEFSYPEFPISYFYNGHNSVNNILLTEEVIQEIVTDKFQRQKIYRIRNTIAKDPQKFIGRIAFHDPRVACGIYANFVPSKEYKRNEDCPTPR